MATTVEELEQRLTRVEQEITRLQQLVEKPLNETPAERVPQMIRDARANQPAISAAIAAAFEEMGIRGEPIGAEKVQQMMLECGVNPEDNEFSRTLIEMRDE